jgi:hypothetical protein
MNIYTNDYLCEYPWSVKGVETVPGFEVNKDSLSEIIREAVQEVIQEKNLPATPKIEKYHIKHR